MITAIIFDMDGVIIDSEPIHCQIEQEIFRELGLEISREDHSRYAGRSDLWEIIKEKYSLDCEIEEIRQRKQHRYLSYLNNLHNVSPIEGVAELIKTFHSKGYTLVLASSSTMDNINLVLENFGLLEYFSRRISGAELKTSKPHPEIFLEAAKMAGADPQHCLVIEDSENGVHAAKAAGMRCIGYKNLNSGHQNLSAADVIIEHFNELDVNAFSGQAFCFSIKPGS